MLSLPVIIRNKKYMKREYLIRMDSHINRCNKTWFCFQQVVWEDFYFLLLLYQQYLILLLILFLLLGIGGFNMSMFRLDLVFGEFVIQP